MTTNDARPDDPLAGDAANPICPACGYDLRGIALGRCPECGFDVEQLGTATSEIPWANRRQIGQIRAYVMTVWLVSFRSTWLRTEMGRPQSISDARRFWAINAALLSIAPVIIYVTSGRHPLATLFNGYLSSIPPYTGARASSVPNWIVFNFGAPWQVGVTLPWLDGPLIAIGVLCCCGVHTYLFHPLGLDRRLASRAVALSFYLCGTMIPPALIVGAILAATTYVPGVERWLDDDTRVLNLFLARLLPLATFLLLLNALVRMPIALRLTTRCGCMYGAFAIAVWPIMVVACAAFFLGLVPWIIGTGWLSIVSIF